MSKKSPQPQPVKAVDEQKSLKESLARALADYSNLEKRFAKDSASVIRFANQGLLTKLLEVHDHLEATIKHFTDPSLKIILTSLDKILSEEGVQVIDTSASFDPASMECAELVDGEKDKIVTTLKAGYRLHDRILRLARVTVGSGNITK